MIFIKKFKVLYIDIFEMLIYKIYIKRYKNFKRKAIGRQAYFISVDSSSTFLQVQKYIVRQL